MPKIFENLNTQLVGGGGVVNYPNHSVTITNTKHKAYFVYLFSDCQNFEILKLDLSNFLS